MNPGPNEAKSIYKFKLSLDSLPVPFMHQVFDKRSGCTLQIWIAVSDYPSGRYCAHIASLAETQIGEMEPSPV